MSVNLESAMFSDPGRPSKQPRVERETAAAPLFLVMAALAAQGKLIDCDGAVDQFSVGLGNRRSRRAVPRNRPTSSNPPTPKSFAPPRIWVPDNAAATIATPKAVPTPRRAAPTPKAMPTPKPVTTQAADPTPKVAPVVSKPKAKKTNYIKVALGAAAVVATVAGGILAADVNHSCQMKVSSKATLEDVAIAHSHHLEYLREDLNNCEQAHEKAASALREFGHDVELRPTLVSNKASVASVCTKYQKKVTDQIKVVKQAWDMYDEYHPELPRACQQVFGHQHRQPRGNVERARFNSGR